MISPAAELIGLLRERGWTAGVAESLTGGDVTSALVSVPGASEVLLGGVIAYATPLKHTLLGVDASLLAERGPVHAEVARQMAEGVRQALRVDGRPADLGIATTGVAGPDMQAGMPVGTVFIGIAGPSGSAARGFLFEGDRAMIRAQATTAALAAAIATCQPRE